MKRLLRLSIGEADRQRDVERELKLHIELRAAELRAEGLDPEHAYDEAARVFGDYGNIAVECGRIRRQRDRERRRRGIVNDVWRDLRHGVRVLLRTPGFTMVAVLTLALGIGASTAVFSVVNAVLFRPLPYAEPERVVVLHSRWDGADEANTSPAEFLDYEEQRVFSAIGAYARGTGTLIGEHSAERIHIGLLTPGAFQALGVAPQFGRLLLPGEGEAGRDAVVILGYGFWQRAFGSDRSIVGRTVQLGSGPAEVVGIMPSYFRLPDHYGVDAPIDLYQPYSITAAAAANRGSHFLDVVARLAPGVELQHAEATTGRIAADFVARFPDDYPADMKFGNWLQPVHEHVVGEIRPLMRIMMVGVAFVLLIACANVATLVLVRSEDRRRELAVRAALGARRGQIVRQLIVENVVLALSGGIAGVFLAMLATRGLVALRPGDIPRMETIQVDGGALLFALAAALVSALLFGVVPTLLSGTRIDSLRESGTRTTSSRRAQLFRTTMVATEVGLSIILLAGAGLMIRSFTQLSAVDPGYRIENVLTFGVTVSGPGYVEDGPRRDFHAVLTERLRALPGVRAAGAVSNLPLASSLGDLGIQIEGRETRADEVSNRLDWQVVTPGYFDAIGIGIVKGRAILPTDDERAPGAVVISESAAKRYFDGIDPIGRRFRLGGNAGPGTVTVVGVARDVRHASLDQSSAPAMYLPHRQFTFWNGGRAVAGLEHVVHTLGDPNDFASAVRRVVAEIDPRVPVAQMRTMEQLSSQAVAEPRFMVSLLGFFAVGALGLAVVGIYGLIAYTVARRTRELGIRAAFGARGSQVMLLVLAQGMRPVFAGAAAGIVCAFFLTRTLTSMLYEVKPQDPKTFAVSILVLIAAALAACMVPALRATRVDPARALRMD